VGTGASKSDKHSNGNGKDGKNEETKNGKSKTGNHVKNQTGNEADDDSPFDVVNDGEAANIGNIVAGPSNPASDEESASMIAFPSPSNNHQASPQHSPDFKKQAIRTLVEVLRRDGQESAIHWLQESLLDTWKVLQNNATRTSIYATFSDHGYGNQVPLEALPSYHIHRGKDIPLVAWSKEHANSLKNKVFLQLLSQMGFHVGDTPNRIFPSIPRAWTANDLLEHAMELGPPASEKYAATLVLHGIMLPGSQGQIL